MAESNHNSEQEGINHSVQILKKLRDDWSDEIPEGMLNGMSENKLFKVRGNWFQGITAHAESLLEYIPKNAPQLSEIQALLDYFYSEDFGIKMVSRTDRDDIDKGNQLINLVLELFGEK